ncbi:MAG TPA: efflux RND transporter periplasmic adaptor subunit [Sedimenticola thiotaurini]|uniref:Efflux RND transporter periplasmic adaptor subunit n=1 Tax=Sedimenticola thiotaurini TaxID=1543721 RepID=A0A831W2N9_9GAMM|nr:efflux RND transporter periplasmic adaptor subunit [Sedimenticola thiotaurini]
MSPDMDRSPSASAHRRGGAGSARRVLQRALLLGLSILVAGCSGPAGQEEPAKPVVRPVKSLLLPRTVGVERSFPGTVRAAKRVDLAFNVPGRIIELPAREGERVAKGALLARIDPTNYQMAVNSAKAEYDDALADYRRFGELVKKGFVSRADYDRTVAKKEVTEASLERARKRLEDTYLRAPFEGVVARRFVENYTEVTAKQPVLSLQDTRQLEVVVDLPEDVVIGEQPDREMKMVATFSALPGLELPVSIKEYATRADPKTLTYRVILALPEKGDANILPGMTAKVLFTPGTAGGRPQFTIPASALLEDDGGRWLWVIDPDTHAVSRRKVEISGSKDGKVLVSSGVEPGELIAVAGVHSLKQGMVVKPVQEIRF